MRHTTSLAVQTIAVVLCLALCRAGRTADRPSEQPTATDTKKERPVAEYWDGGTPFVKPFPLVVIWRDGTVVKRTDDRLMIGKISEARLKELFDQLEKSGFFAERDRVLDSYGLTLVDGPVRCLSVAIGKKQRTLRYHDRPEWNRFEQLGKDASPSRQDRISFVEAWNKVTSLLMGLQVDAMKPFQNDRPLRYPQLSRPRSTNAVMGPGWKWVANIGGNDRITHMHIASLLESKGIDCVMEGSVIYGVEVPKQHADTATRLLCDDAKKRGYWIECGEEDIPHVREATSELTHLPVDQVLSRPEFAADKPLGRFLRSKELSAKLRDYPFVSSLCIREREYLATKDKTETGYEVRVSLRARADDDSKGWYGWYQIWAGGREIASQGAGGRDKETASRE